MIQQGLRFGMVGALATLVHMVIGFLLIQSNWQPLNANFVAFLTAFLVSFVGHLGFTFTEQNTSLASSVWKFAVVAIAGFCANQLLLMGLLKLELVSATIALLISTSFAAILTFVMSRSWAFRAKPSHV